MNYPTPFLPRRPPPPTTTIRLTRAVLHGKLHWVLTFCWRPHTLISQASRKLDNASKRQGVESCVGNEKEIEINFDKMAQRDVQTRNSRRIRRDPRPPQRRTASMPRRSHGPQPTGNPGKGGGGPSGDRSAPVSGHGWGKIGAPPAAKQQPKPALDDKHRSPAAAGKTSSSSSALCILCHVADATTSSSAAASSQPKADTAQGRVAVAPFACAQLEKFWAPKLKVLPVRSQALFP